MTQPVIAPIEQATLSATDMAFKALYDAVVSLALPPGTKVSEAEMATQLQVSRQPVRDAFYRLSALGFLSIRPQRASLITPISTQAVLNAIFTRTALEVECLREAAQRMTAADLDLLHDNLAQQARAQGATDRAQFHAIDEAFHESLCRIAGHAHVWALIREQKAHMDRIRYLTLSEDRQAMVVDEHRAIVDALAAGEVSRAEQALRSHLQGIRAILGDSRDRHPDYFEDSV